MFGEILACAEASDRVGYNWLFVSVFVAGFQHWPHFLFVASLLGFHPSGIVSLSINVVVRQSMLGA